MKKFNLIILVTFGLALFAGGCCDTHGPGYKSADDRLAGYWLADPADKN